MTTESYVIDNQHYIPLGIVSFTEGSGDDTTTWSFQGLEHADTGERCYLELSDWRLYRACDALEPLEEELVRDLDSVEDEAFDEFYVGCSLAWVRISPDATADAPAPFTRTPQGLILRSHEGDTLAQYHSRALLSEGGAYYSAMCPARDMQRHEVPRTVVPINLLPLNLIAPLLLAVFTALPLVWSGATFDPTLVFWLVGVTAVFGRIPGRTFSLYVTFHLLSTAFFLWFMTRVVDNAVIEEAPIDSVEAALLLRIAGLLVVLTVLRLVWQKGYFVLADAAWWSGLICTIGYTTGILIYSAIDEYWWGGHFAWYVGAFPWGYVWPPILGVFLLYKVFDYRDVAMEHRGFVTQVEELREGLRRGPDYVESQAGDLGTLADDLGDAVNIADDVHISSLHAYADTFFTISNVIEKLPELEPTDDVDRERLKDDLVVLAEDLGDLTAPLTKPSGPSLRVTPQIQVLL